MSLERCALIVGGGIAVALTGRNFFFDGKPQRFHDEAAAYARVQLMLSLAIFAAAGPGALLYLLLAEIGWQLVGPSPLRAMPHSEPCLALPATASGQLPPPDRLSLRSLCTPPLPCS